MIRPVGNGVICGANVCPPFEDHSPAGQPIIPFPTGRASGRQIPGISCLAIFAWSLRDKHACVLWLTLMRSRGRETDPLSRATPKKPLPLESIPVPDPIALTPMTMHDGIDRRRPVASRDVVTHEGEFKPAATEQSSGLKRRGKSESAT